MKSTGEIPNFWSLLEGFQTSSHAKPWNSHTKQWSMKWGEEVPQQAKWCNSEISCSGDHSTDQKMQVWLMGEWVYWRSMPYSWVYWPFVKPHADQSQSPEYKPRDEKPSHKPNSEASCRRLQGTRRNGQWSWRAMQRRQDALCSDIQEGRRNEGRSR